MTDSDNLVEYSDPEIYDLENQDFEPDGAFLLDYARNTGGAALEVGCGTGRVTIPLAQCGIDITGLDLVPGMIARGKMKAGNLPIRWITGDARTFQLDRLYRLIFETGSVFQHLLTRPDQEAYLARVRVHLDDDGRFILGVMFPQAEMLASSEDETDWFSYENTLRQEVRVSGVEYYDPLRQVKLETAYRRWVDGDGNEILKVAPLQLRYIFPQELEALLYYNGFQILEQYGDWEKNPLTEKSHMIVTICKKSA